MVASRDPPPGTRWRIRIVFGTLKKLGIREVRPDEENRSVFVTDVPARKMPIEHLEE